MAADEDLTKRKYIRWDDPGVENIPPGEDEDIQAVVEEFGAIQKAMYNAHRHCFTGSFSADEWGL